MRIPQAMSSGRAAVLRRARAGAPVSDAWAVALAVGTALGALAARPAPLWAGVAAAAAAVAARRPLLLCLAAAALASTMAARAWAGLRPPAWRAPVGGVATLVTDPASGAHHSVRVSARPLARSPTSRYVSSQVAVEIGYASAPGALVMDTRKSFGMFLAAPAAAALTVSVDAFTNLPAGFFTVP